MQNARLSTLTSLLLSKILLLSAVSCSSVQIPDIHPGITLPASGDGFQYGTISHDEIRTPAAEWQKKLPRGIIIFSDDWAKLKLTILQNCITNECQQSVGALDNLFIAIDKALAEITPK